MASRTARLNPGPFGVMRSVFKILGASVLDLAIVVVVVLAATGGVYQAVADVRGIAGVGVSDGRASTRI